MEKHLLRLLKLADELNEKQDKVYAEIRYTANDSKTLELCIRTKKDYQYVEKCEMQLNKASLIKWANAIQIFESYVNGGMPNE